MSIAAPSVAQGAIGEPTSTPVLRKPAKARLTVAKPDSRELPEAR